MKYLLMIYGNEETWAAIPAGGWPAAIAEQEAFNAKYAATGELLGAYGLTDRVAAKTVRVRSGAPAVTDGPYLEAKEYLASAWILDCADEQRALEIAAENPYASVNAVELWPIQHESPVFS